MTLRRLALAAVAGLSLVLPAAAPAVETRVVHVRIDQEGLPKESYTEGPILNSRTTASGAFTVSGSLETASFRVQRATVIGKLLIRHVDTIGESEGPGEPAKKTHRLTLRPLELRLATFADGTRVLSLTALVVSSNDPACPVGSRGPMFAADDPHRDSVTMVLCPYDHEHYFEAGLRGHSTVTIQ